MRNFVCGILINMFVLLPLANAALYTYNPDDFLIDSTHSASYTFNVSDQFQSITSASLTAYYYDNTGDPTSTPAKYERVVIQAGSSTIYDLGAGQQLNGSSSSPVSFTGNVLSNFTGLTLSLNMLSGNADPRSNKVYIGDFNFAKYELTVDGTPKSPVPIPSAIFLLAPGLVAMVVMKRRRKI
jgi:hypothetical protein